MKTSIFFLFVVAMSTLVNAQKFVQKPSFSNEEVVSESSKINAVQRNEWTVIWSETFDSTLWHTANDYGVAVPANMPNGWSAVDNTGNNFYWRWSTTGPRGRYTGGQGSAAFIPNNNHRIKSTSDNNWVTNEKGFIMLESDFYNTSLAGQMIDPPVTMDTYIQTRALETTGHQAVSIYFEQWHRFCCASYSESAGPKLYVSNNGTEWVQYSVHKASVNATPRVNPSMVEMSISSIAANQTTVYLRFHHIGQSHYHWSIDDIYLYQPPQYNLMIAAYFADYYAKVRVTPGNFPVGYSTKSSPLPHFAPYHSVQEIIGGDAYLGATGLDPFTNFVHTVSISKSGTEILTESSEPMTLIVDSLYEMELLLNYQIPKSEESIGDYLFVGNFEADQEIGSYAGLPNEFEFNITKNLYGYADPKYAHTDRQTALVSWSSVDGDGIGAIFFLDPSTATIPGSQVPAPHVLKGVNVHINSDVYNWEIWEAGNVANLQAEVYAGTYVGNEWTFDLNNPLITSELCPIDSSFVRTWAYLPFAPEGGNEFVLPAAPASQYLVLIRFYTGNLRFFIGADRFSAPNWFANWLVMGDNLSWTSVTSNIALELVVDPYGQDVQSNIRLLIQNETYYTTHPANGAILKFFYNDNEMNTNTLTYIVDNTGIVDIEGLRSGSYAYTVQYFGLEKRGSVTVSGVDATKEIWFNIGSIENQPMANTLKLYPNPAENLLTVESTTEPLKMEITNLLGQTLKTVVNPTASQTVDISGLATGVYVVTVVDRGNGRVSKMFVKQ
jgi:hypothetical protein